MGDGSEPRGRLTATATDLIARYAWAIDDRAYGELLEVFTSDVIADYEAFTCRGAADLVAKMEEVHQGVRTTQHLVGSVVAAASGEDAARVRSQVRATLVGASDSEGRVEVAASYRDRMVATPEGWRIAERRVQGRWIAGDRSMLPWLRK